jgi:protein-tyrosine phosphatase
MKRILMVCLGNICRSPLAEGILKSKVNSDRVFVDSAGTGGWHIGALPDARSIEVAINNDIDITDQRGRKFTISDFDDFDIIYVMDRSNYENVISLSRNQSDNQKVKMIRDEILSTKGSDVPDPYFGGESGFDLVYQMIDEVCDIIAKKLNDERQLW